MYVVIWQYKIKSDFRSRFVDLYGPEGEWIAWFKKSPDYLGTDLLQLNDTGDIYITIDRWKSKKLYEEFYNSDRASFGQIDRKGETFTSEEKLIGAYTSEVS